MNRHPWKRNIPPLRTLLGNSSFGSLGIRTPGSGSCHRDGGYNTQGRRHRYRMLVIRAREAQVPQKRRAQHPRRIEGISSLGKRSCVRSPRSRRRQDRGAIQRHAIRSRCHDRIGGSRRVRNNVRWRPKRQKRSRPGRRNDRKLCGIACKS